MYPKKLVFQGKKKENTYTPKSPQCVCGGSLRAALVYRFWPPSIGAQRKRKDFYLMCRHMPFHCDIFFLLKDILSRFLGTGCDEALFSAKKVFFSVRRGMQFSE